MKKMSFLKYITQSSGFGETSWAEFGLIQFLCLIFIVSAIVNWGEEEPWVPIWAVILIESTLIYATWKRWKGDWL